MTFRSWHYVHGHIPPQLTVGDLPWSLTLQCTGRRQPLPRWPAVVSTNGNPVSSRLQNNRGVRKCHPTHPLTAPISRRLLGDGKVAPGAVRGARVRLRPPATRLTDASQAPVPGEHFGRSCRKRRPGNTDTLIVLLIEKTHCCHLSPNESVRISCTSKIPTGSSIELDSLTWKSILKNKYQEN